MSCGRNSSLWHYTFSFDPIRVTWTSCNMVDILPSQKKSTNQTYYDVLRYSLDRSWSAVNGKMVVSYDSA